MAGEEEEVKTSAEIDGLVSFVMVRNPLGCDSTLSVADFQSLSDTENDVRWWLRRWQLNPEQFEALAEQVGCSPGGTSICAGKNKKGEQCGVPVLDGGEAVALAMSHHGAFGCGPQRFSWFVPGMHDRCRHHQETL